MKTLGVCGAVGSIRYLQNIIDGQTSWSWAYALRKKMEVPIKVIELFAQLEGTIKHFSRWRYRVYKHTFCTQTGITFHAYPQKKMEQLKGPTQPSWIMCYVLCKTHILLRNSDQRHPNTWHICRIDLWVVLKLKIRTPCKLVKEGTSWCKNTTGVVICVLCRSTRGYQKKTQNYLLEQLSADSLEFLRIQKGINYWICTTTSSLLLGQSASIQRNARAF